MRNTQTKIPLTAIASENTFVSEAAEYEHMWVAGAQVRVIGNLEGTLTLEASITDQDDMYTPIETKTLSGSDMRVLWNVKENFAAYFLRVKLVATGGSGTIEGWFGGKGV